MLNRVQRELATAHPLSVYKKRNSVVVLNGDNSMPQIVIDKNAKGYRNNSLDTIHSITSSGAGSKRKILQMLQDVNTKRTIRECRESDEELGSVLGIHTFFNHQTNNYKQKFKVYNFLNRPKGFWPISYHILVFIMVFACLIVTVFSTINEFEVRAMHFLLLLEKVIIIWFSSEFMLRMWSSSCKHQYQGLKGKIKYLSVPSRILDVIVITLSIFVLTINPSSGHEVFAFSAFRGFHRFFQVLQILTLKKQLQPWKVLSSVIYDQREQLFIIFYIEFIVLCFLAYLSYIVEKDDNEQFDSIAEAMWWALVTLSTVGYGDRIPITWLGKLISSIFTILGVAIFALPAGIIGTGLALKVEEEERNQQRKKKKVAAAVLIQSAWRCYKANANYLAVSTFFRHKPWQLFKKHDYENVAIKFVRLTQFFIAKQRFKELLRPLDIKNVLQSYKDGQLDVMNKVKTIQHTIDNIVRKISLNEQKIYGSNSSLENKIEKIEATLFHIKDKIERQMTSIQDFSSKVTFNQTLVDMIAETNQITHDRRRRQSV